MRTMLIILGTVLLLGLGMPALADEAPEASWVGFCVSPCFEDVPLDHPFRLAIEELYRLGITSGCATPLNSRPYYCPDRLLTRGEVAVLLQRVLEHLGQEAARSR